MTPIRISGLVATGALLLVPAAASAATVDPAHHEGNPSCSALGYAHGLKFDPPTAGSKSAGGVSIDLSLGSGTFGKLVGWSSSAPVDAVIVKGGPNANVYAYSGGATGDSGLHTPFNGPSKYYGLSHVSFCWDGHGNPPADDPPADDPPADNPPHHDPPCDHNPPADDPPADDPPADNPPADDPPADTPPADDPPADNPPADTPPAVVPPASTPAVVTPPETQVLARSVRSGRSRMRGTSGCAGRMVKAKVSGRRIAKVVFRLDGRVVKTTRGAGSYAVRSATIGFGRHRIVARVTYKPGSGTRPRTHVLTFQRCALQTLAPRFTG